MYLATKFDSMTSKFGTTSTIVEFYKALQIDSPAKEAARTACNPDDRALAKKNLPQWFTGGVMKGGSSESSITELNGLIQIDIDSHHDRDRGIELKNRLFECPFCVLASVSASARGAFGLINVGIDVQRDPKKQADLYKVLNLLCLYDAREGENIDVSCQRVAQRRFESYDPAPYLRLDAPKYEEFEIEALNAFKRSKIYEAAQGFTRDPRPESGETGAVLAYLAILARGSVWGSLERTEGNEADRNFYPYRFQGVILGDSGASKTTRIKQPLEDLCQNLENVRFINAGSDRALEKAIVDSCTEVTYPANDKGKEDFKNPIWTQRDPDPILAIFDEAAADQESQSNTQYKLRINAIRRKAFDKKFTASTSLNTVLPTFPLFTSYTDVRLSTPEAWAKAMHGSDLRVGDARRVLEFWVDTPKGPGNCPPFLFDALHPAPKPNLKIVRQLEYLKEDQIFGQSAVESEDGGSKPLKLSGYNALWPLISGMETIKKTYRIDEANQDYKTIVTQIATAAAFARGSVEKIEMDDILTGWSVYLGVLKNRARLNSFDQPELFTSRDRTSREIEDYISRNGTVRHDALTRKFGAPDQRGILGELIQSGKVIKEKVMTGDKARYFCRLATDEEMAIFDETRERLAQAAREKKAHDDEVENRVYELQKGAKKDEKGLDNAAPIARGHEHDFDNEIARAQKDFKDCDDSEKSRRVDKYTEIVLKERPLIEGDRNNAIRSLRGKFDQAGFSGDPIAERKLVDLALSCGLSEKETRNVTRPIKGGKQ